MIRPEAQPRLDYIVVMPRLHCSQSDRGQPESRFLLGLCRSRVFHTPQQSKKGVILARSLTTQVHEP